jgi:hypothetical protein
MLVFSKTSFQRDAHQSKSPRAVFLNDGCYIGYVGRLVAA